ncbi:MAG: hypothetical protein J3R72DRAFT_521935 [Linnemannia gamsii]|nr:MAG: hypothetical protein J3R72DRAFT_521935 [Linnemannia gamsii]
MTRSPENDAMAIDLTHSRDQSPASEATFRTLTLQSPTLCQLNEWQYPPRTITSSGNKDLPPLLQQRPWNHNDKENERVSQTALKRKNQEEDLPRKRDSLLMLQSSSPATGSHTSTLASLLAALRDDTQAGDSDCHQTNVEHSTVNAVETGVGGEMEKANRSRTHNSGARSRAIDKKKASRNYMLSYFKEWCIRKEYTDGDWVTREKYIAYAKEITAPQSHTDNDIPRLSVKPLFVKSRIGRSAQRASLSTVENYLRAVRVLYKSQCLVDGIIPNVVEGLGKAEIDAIMKDYDKLLKYTTSKRLGKGGKDEGGEEEGSEDEGGEDEGDQDDADNSEDEDDASGESNPSREGSVPQEETISRQQDEPLSTAPSVQESRQQSDDEQDDSKIDSNRSNAEGKRSLRALTPISQRQYQHFIFAGASQWHHLSHQTQWKEWCIRKRYTDGYRVTSKKFIAYAKELTAQEEYYDKDNPHLCVKPFIVNAHKGPDARRASKSTVRAALTAVRALYMDQCTREKVAPNVIVDLAKTAIDTILMDYQNLLKSDPSLPRVVSPDGQDIVNVHQDVERRDSKLHENVQQEAEYQEEEHHETEHQEASHQETVQKEVTLRADARSSAPERAYSLVLLRKSMKTLWTPQTKHSSRGNSWMFAQRDRLRLAYGFFETDTGTNLAALLPPQLHHLQIRSEHDVQVTNAVAVVVDSRKAYSDSERYSIFLREDDVHICPVGALAFFLLAKWMDKKSYPNFDNDNWTTVPVEFLNDALKAGDITSSEHEGGSSLISQFAVSMYTKVDVRPYRAFFDHLTRSPSPVQSKYKKIPPIFLSATLSQKAVFGLSRNRILPPPDLQRQLFPFVEDFYDDSKDWKIWVENIMMDRPEDANRLQERERDNEYYRADYPIIRLLLFVAGLRKVILQDFAAMLAGEGSEEGEKRMGYDHIFAIKHPVLSSPAFREFTTHLREAMVADPAEQSKTVAETNQPAEEATVQTLQVQETRSLANRTRSVTVIRQASEEPYLDSFVDGMTDTEIAIVEEQPLSTEESLPIVARTQHQGTETDSLLQTIQELCARVASLEQHEKPGQDTERPTPSSATTTIRNQVSTSAVSQVKNTSIDMDTTMDVDMEVDVAVTADRGAKGNITSNKKDSERLLQENQDLRDKVAALERVNRELAELNQVRQRLSSSRTPEPPILLTRAASVPRSRVVSVAHDGHTNGSNRRGGGTAYFSPVSVVQDHHSTLSTITTVANNTISNQSTNSNRSNRSETPTSLRQEVQDLRNQLASLEQEEQQVLDYATVAIESVEFLDNKINQIEQSMHGLWSMIARNEAAKFAASLNAPASLTAAAAVTSGGPRSPRSPSLGLSSPPPLTGATAPAAFPLQYQHQHQDPLNRLAARLRVDTLPLRSRVASAASSNASAADVASSVHGKMRS